ncbi:MAG: hypothetical protein GX029_05910 [Pseudomonadaceae bacterium]|nr:hypothetical protein [Pseudomonadaceae bacterium]
MVLPFITALISAGAAIMSAVSSIGTAVSTFVATVGPTLASLLAKAGPMIEKMAHFANSFLEIANILQQGEDVRHLGDRALQAANALSLKSLKTILLVPIIWLLYENLS